MFEDCPADAGQSSKIVTIQDDIKIMFEDDREMGAAIKLKIKAEGHQTYVL